MSGDYSGGQIGITPLAVMLAVSIQFVFSVALLYLLKRYVTGYKRIFFFIVNIILYELCFLFFADSPPILKISEPGFIGFLNKGYFLSSAVSCGFIMIAYYIFELIKRRNVQK